MNEDVPICHCAEYYGSHAPDCPIAAEVRALRADVVWVCKTPEVGEQVERIMKIATPLDADILRAVREARER